MQKLTTLVFCFLSASACCQPQPALLPPDKLKSELTFLFNTLKETHPALHRHTSSEALQQKFNSLQTQLKEGLTSFDFYRVAWELTAAVKCGHTRLRPPAELTAQLRATGKFFPLPVRFANKTMYAKLPDQSLHEVQAINGTPVSEIVSVLFARMAVDGNAENAKYDWLQRFWFYYAWLYNHKAPTFELQLKSTADVVETKTFAAIDQAAALQLRFNKGADADTPISFSQKPDFGYLNISTFSSGDYRAKNIDYYAFLAQTFQQLKQAKISTLVVDIRGNGGGDDQYGATLCRYLTATPFRYFRKVEEVRGGKMMTVDHPCLQPQPVAPDAFTGKIFILTDGRTFSTAADVASVFGSNRMGTIVGRETGGGYEGNTSGRSENIALPLTGIVINIPLWYYENEVAPARMPHCGVIPDVEIQDSLTTLQSQRDPVLEYVTSRLR